MTDPYSTHQNMLRKCIEATTGPVLELGIGASSTPLIHEMCVPNNRRVVSYDTDAKYLYKYREIYKGPLHQFYLIGRKEWGDENLEGWPMSWGWSVVLVDHKPAARRRHEIERLKDCAELIVCHDTEPQIDRFYRFSRIWKHFRYIYHDQSQIPWTSVLSNSAAAFRAFEQTMERA